METSTALAHAFEVARTASLVVSRPRSGVLVATGATRLDLIQRLSTNDLSGIGEGEVRTTVLTTAIGRIVDRLQVLSLGDRLVLMTSPGREKVVHDWLLRHVFFQDDVQLASALPATREWFLAGLLAADRLRQALSLPAAPASGHAIELPGGLLWGTRPPEPPGFRLLAESSENVGVSELMLGKEPAEAGDVYEGLRIEFGYPEFGHEFSDGDIPLEVGLTYAVSFTKGCYLGQEIIARMDSRARIPRHLVGVLLDGPLATPAEVLADPAPIGRVTSAAWSPRHGWIGLAVVRSQTSGTTTATIGDSSRVRLVPLPFSEGEPASAR